MVWLFAAAMTVMGKVSGDVVVSALPAGLVMFLALIGFTVTQYAFQTGEPGAMGEDAGQFKLRMMALEASGASIWEWDGRRDEINTGPEVESTLGLAPGSLRCGRMPGCSIFMPPTASACASLCGRSASGKAAISISNSA